MMYREATSCWLAIQVRVGTRPDGRARHRTVSLRHVRQDETAEELADFIRAYEKVAMHPVTKVTRVTKRVLSFDRKAQPVTVTRTAVTNVTPVAEANGTKVAEMNTETVAAKPLTLTTNRIIKSWDFTKPSAEDATAPAAKAVENRVRPVPAAPAATPAAADKPLRTRIVTSTIIIPMRKMREIASQNQKSEQAERRDAEGG
jgi:hypothetical protein